MPISLSEARQLCTKPELELFNASRTPEINRLSTARLRQKIGRSRKLRDKWRDEAQRQRRESRGKQDPRATRAARGNVRTARKSELFAEALARFEKRLQQLEAQEAKAAEKAGKAAGNAASRKKPAAKKSSPPAADVKAASTEPQPSAPPESAPKPRKKSVPRPPKTTAAGAARKSRRKAASSDVPGKQARIQQGGGHRIHGHTSGRGKRSQARRDRSR